MNGRICFGVVLFLLAVAGQAQGGTVGVLPEFAATDRVLVVVPHPDDETIGFLFNQ